MKGEYIVVITTTDEFSIAEKISTFLVENKLSACVQISEIDESIYTWEGKIEKVKEYKCTIKTKKNLYREVEKAIKKIHNYSIPEIIAIPIIDGNKDYLNWIDEVTKYETR